MSFTITSLMSRVRSKLNDSEDQLYHDADMLNFAIDSFDELEDNLALYGIPVVKKISAAITVPIGTVSLSAPTPSLLPADMLVPLRLEERLSGSSDLYIPMVRREWEPDIMPSDSLRYWTYREEDIKFVGATSARQVKIYYIKHLTEVATGASTIAVNNADLFMVNSIAAMAARYIGENPTRADELDKEATEHMEHLIRIAVKSKQGTRTRRRPYQVSGRRRWI